MKKHIFSSFSEANDFAKSSAKNGGKVKLIREGGSFIAEVHEADIQEDFRQHDSKYPAQIAELKDKHKKHVESMGEEYAGVTEKSVEHDTKATKCDSCHETTDGDIKLECNVCRGAICSKCGVCRCEKFPF